MIEIVDQYKYLGIMLDEFLKIDKCAQALSSAGGRALGAIITKFKSLKDVGYTTFKKLFESGVKPITEYGSGVWGYARAKECEIIQNRAMRYFLGVHRFAPIAGMIGDLGWIRPYLERYVCILRLWNRLIAMHDDRITKKIFQWALDAQNVWVTEIRQIFNSLHLDADFDSLLPCDIDSVKLKMIDLAREAWEHEILAKPKLRTYRTFKATFASENYVIKNISRRKLSLLCQLRIGILPLRIETGRFRNFPVEERVCEICGNGDIEDEKHFVWRISGFT